GEMRSKIERLVIRYKLESFVKFTGFRNDIPAILKGIDIYCLPSLWEGLPIGIIEAMAMGKAVIASAVDGTKELIEDGVNGLHISIKSPEELSQKILLLAENKERIHMLGKQAAQFIRENFDVKKMTQATEQCYLKLNPKLMCARV
ncbi:MAG: glycosyltransferase family 4 protein, partial [Flavobacteriaceae bacterium]|nr:glycosyltransferase family 4 protein [Flavobacteriaceae bacterium]